MSDDQNDIQTTADAEFAVEDSGPPEKAARGNGVAWLAVFLAAIAVLLVGYTIFEDWRTADDSSQLDSFASIDFRHFVLLYLRPSGLYIHEPTTLIKTNLYKDFLSGWN